MTVTRFDILTSFWGPFQHLRPFSFNIWDLIGYLRPFSAFDTLLVDIWDLIRYLRPFSAFDTLFIQHLKPYSLFETFFSIWDPFHSTLLHHFFYLRPVSAFDTLLADSAARTLLSIDIKTILVALRFTPQWRFNDVIVTKTEPDFTNI